MKDEIENRIIKSALIDWHKLEWLQGDLKAISPKSMEHLKQSLKAKGFVQPFNVWQNKKLWCLDGHHRRKAMIELEEAGTKIPKELPANFVRCSGMREAKDLVLTYSAIFARILEARIPGFLDNDQALLDRLRQETDLPGVDLDSISIENLTRIDQADLSGEFASGSQFHDAVALIIRCPRAKLDEIKPSIIKVCEKFGLVLKVAS